MARDTHPVGAIVVVAMGLDSNKIATVVPMSKIKLDSRRVPLLGRGHYHPITKDDRAIQYEDGVYDVHRKSNLIVQNVKYIYTLILPDNGKEVVIGAYCTEGQARASAKKKFAADYLSFCAYPLKQRQLKTGEQVRSGDLWQG